MNKKLLMASTAVLSFASLISTQFSPVFAEDTKKVVVYSNTLNDESRLAKVEELAKEAGFELEVVVAGSGDIYNRVLAEKADPQADVVIGLDEANWLNLQDEVKLHDFEPVWANEIDSEAILGAKAFYPFAESYIFGLYNPDNVTEDQVPKRLEELGEDPALSGKYRIPENLGGSTHQKIILSILMQYSDENGELGISEEGWDKVAKFIKNGYQTREDEDHWQLIKDGDLLFDYFHASGTATAMDKDPELNVKPINPEYGVFTMREQIGILDKGEDNDYANAEEFVNWFGSDEVQKTLAEEFGFIPLTSGAKDGLNETMKSLIDQVTPMNVDWDLYRDNVDAWVEKLELDYMP